MALIAPALWAGICLIDVCFVAGDVYKTHTDGAVITGLFCLLPCLMIFAGVGDWEQITLFGSLIAIGAGVFYYLHIHYYFRALFSMNDACHIEIFGTLSVLLVPIMAFLFIGEQLSAKYYFVIALALVGVVILIRFNFSGVNYAVLSHLTLSVAFISAVMVMQSWVFEEMGYWNGTLLFSASSFITALLVLSSSRTQRQRTFSLCKRFWPIFLGAEALERLPIMASQRAIDLGPSVSLVAVIESSLPIFIIAYSYLLLHFSRKWTVVSQEIRHSIDIQTHALPVKLVSLFLITSAIALL